MPDDSPISKQAVLGGAKLLLGRNIAGLGVSFIGMLLLARMIGPSTYGMYTAAFGITFFLQTVGALNIGVYLKRYEQVLTDEVCDRAVSFSIILAIVAVSASLLAVPALSQYIGIAGFGPTASATFITAGLVILQQVPLARLERVLDYANIGKTEVLAQVSFFCVALPLAFLKFGVWAPISGLWTQQILLLIGYWRTTKYRPKFVWRFSAYRDFVAYGVPATAASVVFGLRGLTATLVVGRDLGAASLGFISLAIRLLEQLSIGRQVINRLTIPVFSQLGKERERFRRIFTSSVQVQFLSVAAPTVVFALTSWFVIPIVFGPKWAPVAQVIPLLAPSYLALGVFSAENMLLTLSARPVGLIISQSSNALTLLISAYFLVPLAGIRGYAYAEMVVLLTWFITDALLARVFPRPDYRAVLPWLVGTSIACLSPIVSWWMLLGLPLMLVPRQARVDFIAMARLLGSGDRAALIGAR